jgi:hypothetical protein
MHYDFETIYKICHFQQFHVSRTGGLLWRVPDGGVIFFKAARLAVGVVGVGPPKVFPPQGGHLHTFSRIHSASAGATIPTLPVNTVNAGVVEHIILGGI